MNKINDLRLEIDEIDRKILELIVERLDIVKKIGKIKEQTNLQVVDKNREKQIFDKLKYEAQQKGLNLDMVEKIWRVLMDISYKIEGGKNGNS